MTLTDFLLARIAEDEGAMQRGRDYIDPDDALIPCTPARVLAEVEAKRRIVEMHAADQDGASDENWHGLCVKCGWAGLGEGYPCETVRCLALPYADHPDYDDSWRP